MPTEIFVLSGLGADKQVFINLKPNANFIHLNYIDHKQGETLKAYAARMAEQITEDNAILMGLSFGGLIAQEIARTRRVKHLILLSTVRKNSDFPWYYRCMGKLRFPYILPSFMLERSNILLNWMFGLENKTEKKMLNSFLRNTSNSYLRWALNAISKWQAVESKTPSSQIQGESDRVFPSYFMNSKVVLLKGGHFGCYSEGQLWTEEINRILDKINDSSF